MISFLSLYCKNEKSLPTYVNTGVQLETSSVEEKNKNRRLTEMHESGISGFYLTYIFR